VARTLPDLLRPGLDLVFVGINPGEESARRGHYYAHPGNAFWPAVTASGLVPRPVTAKDDRWLLAHAGIGFTDVVKRVVTDSTDVTDAELRASLAAFRGRIAYARPRVVCFTSGRAYDRCFPRTRAAGTWGRQPVTMATRDDEAAEVWLMPSSSGLAAALRPQMREVLAGLAAEIRGVRAA
jgi:TDG/mug DNA glycosylase family protein